MLYVRYLNHPISLLQGKSYCGHFSDENVKALKGTSGVGEGVLVLRKGKAQA